MTIIEQEKLHEVATRLTTTMKAAIVEDFTRPLAVKYVPKPIPGPGEVVVRIEASGLCHTDIHAAHGDWPVKPARRSYTRPRGRRHRRGRRRGVTEVAVGDRVAMPWLGYACGLRVLRLRLGDALPRAEEHGLLDRRRLRRVRQGVRPLRRQGARGRRPLDAAPLTCAGVTTYKAVKVGGHEADRPRRGLRRRRARPPRDAVRSDRRRARRRRRPRRREAGAREGARRRVHGQRREAGSRSRRSRSSAAPTRRSRSRSRRRRSSRRTRPCAAAGRSSSSALPADNAIDLPIFETVLNGITVVGSIVGTRVDLREVFELHAAGMTRVITEVRPLDAVNESIEEVEAGHVPPGSSSSRSSFQRRRAAFRRASPSPLT